MRVAVDCTGIVPNTSAGVENYAYRVVEAMTAIGEEHSFDLLVPRGTKERWSEHVVGRGNVRIHELLVPAALRARLDGGGVNGSSFGRLVSVVRQLGPVRDIGLQWKARSRQRAIESLAPDVVYAPTHLGGCPDWPAVVTVHDLRPLSERFADRRLARILASVARRADAIVTSWDHPRSELLRSFPWVEPKLRVIPHPPMLGHEEGIAERRDSPYLLYPAGTAPHKNHQRLVRAFAEVRGTRDVRLVCTGPPLEPGFTELRKLVHEMSFAGSVELTGFVSEERLKALYRGAAAVVVPSQWEAASGPILEAVAYGKPVACSLIPPIKQQVEREGIRVAFFDPLDISSIAGAIIEVLDHPERYQRLREGQRSSALLRTWDDVAHDYLSILGHVAAAARAKAVPVQR